MKEDFLHYVWKFQQFDGVDFTTTNKELLHIQNPGTHNFNAGPDFFNAKIALDNQLWAGNVEIHIKSSDWYAHGHEIDAAYDNVILHVVWQHDAEIFRKDGSAIPTFEVGEFVRKSTLGKYQNLFSKQKKWINCENDFAQVDSFVIENWLERLYIERLQIKEAFLISELIDTQNHWEALLFRILCKNFGLNINGASFFSIAKSLEFAVVHKCSQKQQNLEALFMGQAGLLDVDKEDGYFKILQKDYQYLKRKFSLENSLIIPPAFFRLRPPNFPTIRFAQLAALYHQHTNLFSKVIHLENVEDFYDLFSVSASAYWDTHFNFGVSSKESKKRITKSFIDLLIINTVLPIKFSYSVQQGIDASEEILKIASEIPSEKNGIIDKFNSLINISKSALQSQALLQLKSEYCDKHRCLQCGIGNSIVGYSK